MTKALLCLLAAALPLFSQAVRVDPTPVMKTAGNVGPGAYPQLLAVPGAQVSVCGFPANGTPCTNYATAYADSTGTLTCPNNAQVTLGQSNICQSVADTKGNFGFWLTQGNYSYTITYAGVSYGPYPVSVPITNSGLPTIGSQLTYLRSKPNVLSPTLEFAAVSPININDYNFPPQNPGVALSSGVPTTVTLSPQPLGVKGTDAHHYLYISDGLGGSPESVLITGGTANGSGSGTGTVQFTPANSHTGTWTIRSATAGTQEAVLVSQASQVGSVHAPSSTYSLNATVYIDITGNLAVNLGGDGRAYFNLANGTVFNNLATTPAFQVVGGGGTGCEAESTIHDLTIHGSSTSGDGINASNACQLHVDNVFEAESHDHGFVCTSNCFSTHITNSFFFSNGKEGIAMSGLPHAVVIDKNSIQNNCRQAPGLLCNGISISNGNSVVVTSNQFALDGVNPIGLYPSQSNGLGIFNSTGAHVAGNYFEQLLTNAIYLDSTVSGFDLTSNYIQQGGINLVSGATSGTISGGFVVSGNPTVAVTGAVSSGGLCQITLSAAPTPHYTAGMYVDVEGISGSPACNGKSVIQSINTASTQFVSGLAFSGTYTSGGTAEHAGGVLVGGNPSGYSDVHIGGINLLDPTLLIAGGDLLPGPGASIASAATIAPTNTIQPITGSAPIATMTVPSGFAGQFCALNTSGTWTTTTGGNFAAAYSAVANTSKCWQYNPATSKWY